MAKNTRNRRIAPRAVTQVTWEITKTTRGEKVDLVRLPSTGIPRSSRRNAAPLPQPSPIRSSRPHLDQQLSYDDPMMDLEELRPLRLPQKNVGTLFPLNTF